MEQREVGRACSRLSTSTSRIGNSLDALRQQRFVRCSTDKAGTESYGSDSGHRYIYGYIEH